MIARELINEYGRALQRLKEALRAPARDDVQRAGCIQYFEFCFELAWKSINAVLQDAGIDDCASPRASVKAAFAQGMIDDEGMWLAMLKARNRMAHTYDVEEALAIYAALREFFPVMKALLARLREEAGEE